MPKIFSYSEINFVFFSFQSTKSSTTCDYKESSTESAEKDKNTEDETKSYSHISNSSPKSTLKLVDSSTRPSSPESIADRDKLSKNDHSISNKLSKLQDSSSDNDL